MSAPPPFGVDQAPHASAAKVILIGIDSADRHLIESWCESGDLPVLQCLRDRGAYGLLSGFAGMGDDAVWASFYTGISPGRHGRYYWNYPRQGTYKRTLYRDRSPQLVPFWTHLSRSGLRTAIIDVPKCPLSSDLNGVQLADWLVHGRDHAETCSCPPDLAAEVLRRYGEDWTDRVDRGWLCRLHSLSDGEFTVFEQRLLDGLANKTRFACELLDKEPWDLVLIVFKEAHCMGHQGWRFVHPADRVHSRPNANPVKRIYQALDRTIGEIARRAGPETSLIVFSDIGMAPNYTGEHLLDHVLTRLESKITTVRHRIQLAWRRAPRRVAALFSGNARFTPANRLAFQLEHNELSGAIRINLLGREPAGIVQPGEEYERICSLLIEELLALRDPETGEPLVENVLQSDKAFPGQRRDDLPDLFVVWSRAAPINGAQSASVGTLSAPPPNYRTGNHVEGGFYLGVGPRTKAGSCIGSSSIMDLAPTVAALLNTSLPGVEGSPINALCSGIKKANKARSQ